MEWWIALTVLLAGFIVALASGMPVAFTFGLVNLAFVFFVLGSDVLPIVGFSAFYPYY